MTPKAARDIDLAALVSLDSMEGVFAVEAKAEPTRGRIDSLRASVVRLYPGVLASGIVGLAATWLSQHYGAPVMLFALLLGIALHFLAEEGRCRPGIEFCSRTVLRAGVALLGLRITLGQVHSLGLGPVTLVVVGVMTTMLFGRWISLRAGLSSSFGLLSGGAVAICGASAALAISTALPNYRERERDTILVVVGVTTLSTIAMVIYPIIASSIGLSHQESGIFR